MGDVTSGSESHRIHMIVPLFVQLACLVDNVEIGIKEEVRGNYLTVNGHFEVLMKQDRPNRPKKIIAITEMMNADMLQGQVQTLLGL